MSNYNIQNNSHIEQRVVTLLLSYLECAIRNCGITANVNVVNTPLPTTDTNGAAMLTQLQTIAGDTTALEALQTNSNALITTMNGYVDQIEGLLAAIETNGGDLETILTAVGLNTVDIENILTDIRTNVGYTTDVAATVGSNGTVIAILKGVLNSLAAVAPSKIQRIKNADNYAMNITLYSGTTDNAKTIVHTGTTSVGAETVTQTITYVNEAGLDFRVQSVIYS